MARTRSRTPLTPRTWTPPRDRGRVGPFAVNDEAGQVRTIALTGVGPEDVLVDEAGRVLTGLADGRVLRVSADGRHVEQLADTQGRPCGLEWHPEGWVVVCDAERGLLRLDPASGAVSTLVADVGGVRMRFTNNASVAADGTIYFSDSSTRFGIREFKGDLLAHSRTGRLLRRSPDGTVEVLIEGLAFANGVALAGDESFVLVAETGGYRVTRLELTGAQQGRTRVIVDNLPGLPDNMSSGSDGVFWIAMPSTRNRLLDALLPRPGFLRSLVWAVPDRLQPDADRITWVIGIDGEGRVVRNLQGSGADYHYVTGVREHEGRLYLGSLAESAIGVVELSR